MWTVHHEKRKIASPCKERRVCKVSGFVIASEAWQSLDSDCISLLRTQGS